jgi:hypothetical protein
MWSQVVLPALVIVSYILVDIKDPKGRAHRNRTYVTAVMIAVENFCV